MKVAIVNRHRDDALGGSEIQCDFIATGLTERGHEVVYIAPGGSSDLQNRFYRVVPCGLNSKDIANAVLENTPDVVYWRYNTNQLFSTVKTIKKRRIPVVFALSHINDVTKWLVRKNVSYRRRLPELLKHRRNVAGIRYVDALTANNRDHLGNADVSIQRYIPNGMSRSLVPFEWPRPFSAWVANIKKTKRPELYVDLAREFESSGMDFLMAGPIRDRDYNWLLEDGQLPKNFHYLGPKTLEEASGILASAETLIHTCHPEGFPNVFIQAWLQGTPTVSFGFDPCGYIASENMGYCVDEDWELFVDRVRHLHDHPEVAERLGQNAARFAGETFSINTTVDAVEELFQELVEGGVA